MPVVRDIENVKTITEKTSKSMGFFSKILYSIFKMYHRISLGYKIAIQNNSETKESQSFEVSSNPYADKDGAPLKGQRNAFFEWEEKRRLASLNKLSQEKKKQLEENERRLFHRMQS